MGSEIESSLKNLITIAYPTTFSERWQKNYQERIKPSLNSLGFQTWSEEANLFREVRNLQFFPREYKDRLSQNLLAAVDQNSILLAVLDGTDVHPAVALRVGYAFAKGKKIVGYRNDFRISADNDGSIVNLQVEYFIHASGGLILPSLEDVKSYFKHFNPSNIFSYEAIFKEVDNNVEILNSLYMAGPFGFSENGRDFFYKDLMPLAQEKFVPQDPWVLTDGNIIDKVTSLPYGPVKKAGWQRLNHLIGRNNLQAISRSPRMLAVLDEGDSGTYSEIGCGFGLRKIIYGYHGEKNLNSDVADGKFMASYCIRRNGGELANSVQDTADILRRIAL